MNKQLEDYLPYLKECIGNIDRCKNINGTSSIFYVPMNQSLSEFVSTFYALDIANGKYSDYLEERDMKSLEDIEDKFEKLSLEDLYAVLTLYIRTDRFVSGHIVKLAENGTLYKTVKKIVELT